MRQRRFRWLVLGLLACAGCGKGHEFVTPMAGQSDAFVIRNVRVFDAPRAALLDGTRDVLIREGRVATVGLPGEVHEAVREIDGGGKTLVPGLIDVHVHSGGSPSPPWHTEFPDADENLGALLYAGVTTVLDAAALTPPSSPRGTRSGAGRSSDPASSPPARCSRGPEATRSASCGRRSRSGCAGTWWRT